MFGHSTEQSISYIISLGKGQFHFLFSWLLSIPGPEVQGVRPAGTLISLSAAVYLGCLITFL